jgi:uncharacterized repeat protein (TIGR03803 family)
MRVKPLLLSLVLLLATAAQAQYPFQVLHAFTGGSSDGGGLWGSVVADKQGNIYGVTFGGGPNGDGTVFELSPQSNGSWNLTTLHSFPSTSDDGEAPWAGPTFDAARNLYGTTQGGGPNTNGTVFELTPGADGWAESVLYGFSFSNTEVPYAGVAVDQDDNVFGTAYSAYEVSPGSDGWTEELLHFFSGQDDDGYFPQAAPILDQAGNLYGTTRGGGGSPKCTGYNGCGTVYELEPVTGGWATHIGWKESILHRFGYTTNDGRVPSLGPLAIDNFGNLYGATTQGGSNICVDIGCGTIFKLARNPASFPGAWKETILYDFVGGTDGSGPGGGLVVDQSGNLYGTTVYGGDPLCGCGVVFELSPQPNGQWHYTVLHTFVGSDGAQPDANLTLGPDGNLYGTTATGGAGGAGVVFQIQIAPQAH